jgi:hypothetical protein
MPFRVRPLVAAAAFLLILSSVAASAQSLPPPPHSPGTMCLTGSFWCWASEAGAVGTPCLCPAPGQTVSGRLG